LSGWLGWFDTRHPSPKPDHQNGSVQKPGQHGDPHHGGEQSQADKKDGLSVAKSIRERARRLNNCGERIREVRVL
jgi:hypothetical protein